MDCTRPSRVSTERQLTAQWAVHGGSGCRCSRTRPQSASRVRKSYPALGASFFAECGARHRLSILAGDHARSRRASLRANVNGEARGVHLSVFGERQTQAPTARQILTDVPWLQSMLDRLGLAAETPQQLADLLRTNAELSATVTRTGFDRRNADSDPRGSERRLVGLRVETPPAFCEHALQSR